MKTMPGVLIWLFCSSFGIAGAAKRAIIARLDEALHRRESYDSPDVAESIALEMKRLALLFYYKFLENKKSKFIY